MRVPSLVKGKTAGYNPVQVSRVARGCVLFFVIDCCHAILTIYYAFLYVNITVHNWAPFHLAFSLFLVSPHNGSGHLQEQRQSNYMHTRNYRSHSLLLALIAHFPNLRRPISGSRQLLSTTSAQGAVHNVSFQLVRQSGFNRSSTFSNIYRKYHGRWTCTTTCTQPG